MLLLLELAAAQDTSTSVGKDGTIELRTVVNAPRADVLASLRDPVEAGRLSPDTLSIVPTPMGRCTQLDLRVRGLTSPLSLTAMRCPTNSGWTYDLVQSESVTSFHAEWTLTDMGDQTEVVYRVRSEVDLPVPDSFVQRGVLSSARETLAALIRKVTRR